mgnify:CR=1 FL=1
MDPVLCSIADAARLLGIGKTKTYELIDAGQLATVAIGVRRMVTVESIKRLAKGSAGVTDLARHAQLNPGAMTRLLDRLEERGVLERVADPDDHRALNIVLTGTGLSIWADINHCGQRVRERAVQGMDAGEREQLFRLLDQVLRNLTPPHPND